jgi:hypothetical protein
MAGINARAVPNLFLMSKGSSFFVPYIRDIGLSVPGARCQVPGARCQVSEAWRTMSDQVAEKSLYNEYAEEYTAGNETKE